MPAYAGIHVFAAHTVDVDARIRGHDEKDTDVLR